MATESNQISLGSDSIEFDLFNPYLEKFQSLDDLKSDKGTVIIFMCNHCPYVIHIIPKLVELANYYIKKGISFVGISSNDILNYPEDSPENMAHYVDKYDLPFPYLFDETQEIAKAYDAACTPDFYVYDGDNKLYYHGRFDETRPQQGRQATGDELAGALNLLLDEAEFDGVMYPSIGCSIKWKDE
ncbi:MAG: alkyl hydroperoxide reductase [Ignavibacteria bacterium GWF2_33_9]|nr:MAG: alkyl hydroperoxide reductase [Ignavibacteria bacterium GWF2_33_9]